MAPISIRRATHEDAPFLAWAILTATRSHLSKGWFEVALARPEDECLEFLELLTTTTIPSQWHHSGFLVAEGTPGPVSTLYAARAADTYSTAPMAILEALKQFGLSTAQRTVFWKRAAPWFICSLRPDKESLAFENIATLPPHRGQGHTSALLARAFEEGRARTITEAQITCMIGNDFAERAYTRAGFRFLTEWRHHDFERAAGTPGMRKFSRAL